MIFALYGGFHAASLLKLIIHLIEVSNDFLTLLTGLLDLWHQTGLPGPG